MVQGNMIGKSMVLCVSLNFVTELEFLSFAAMDVYLKRGVRTKRERATSDMVGQKSRRFPVLPSLPPPPPPPSAKERPCRSFNPPIKVSSGLFSSWVKMSLKLLPLILLLKRIITSPSKRWSPPLVWSRLSRLGTSSSTSSPSSTSSWTVDKSWRHHSLVSFNMCLLVISYKVLSTTWVTGLVDWYWNAVLARSRSIGNSFTPWNNWKELRYCAVMAVVLAISILTVITLWQSVWNSVRFDISLFSWWTMSWVITKLLVNDHVFIIRVKPGHVYCKTTNPPIFVDAHLDMFVVKQFHLDEDVRSSSSKLFSSLSSTSEDQSESICLLSKYNAVWI